MYCPATPRKEAIVEMQAQATARALPRLLISRNGRDIGPIGTASRVLGGLMAIALPVALAGFTWWDAAIALGLLPLIAALAAMLITAIVRRTAPRALGTGHAICSPAGCSLIVLVLLANAALAALTPANGNVTIWVWLGASMLLAAARGYGGCEVLALSNLLTGRRDQIGCLLYWQIDRWEAARSGRPPAPPQGHALTQ
jgi:hypothetical protein